MLRSVATRWSWLPFVSLSLVVGLPTGSAAQAVQRSLYVSVTDDKGAPVPSVTPADVVVREDGVQREVLRVTPATEPMQIAVLVDTSAVLQAETTNVRDALTAFVEKMTPQHQVAIIEYGDRPNVLTDSTTDPVQLKKGIGAIFPRPNSGAYMLDAILETSRGFQKREDPRPVIVVVGMEDVEFSNASYDRVLDALKAGGAPLNVLLLTRQGGPDMATEEARARAIVIDRGTRETGGRRENLLSGMSFKPQMEALAEDLLHQWRVVYGHPQTLIPPQQVTVEAARPGLNVRGTPVKPAKGA